MKDRSSKTKKKSQTFTFESIAEYVKNYAKTCRQSYLSLLSI